MPDARDRMETTASFMVADGRSVKAGKDAGVVKNVVGTMMDSWRRQLSSSILVQGSGQFRREDSDFNKQLSVAAAAALLFS